MFGFFRKKAIKVIAVNVVQELVMDKIRGEHFYGRTATEIATLTGLKIVAVYGMLNRLVEYQLIEEIDEGELSYRALSVPSRILSATSSNEVFSYAKASVERIDFRGI